MCAALQAAIQRCSQLRHLELLTHLSWKVDKPCPLKARETIVNHLFQQLPNLKVSAIITHFSMQLHNFKASITAYQCPGSSCSDAR